MRHVLLMAVRLALTGISLAGSPDTISSSHDGDLASIRSLVPADHPEGNKAKVTLISVKRMETLHDSILSTFIVDYAPGGSAILHHKSAPGRRPGERAWAPIARARPGPRPPSRMTSPARIRASASSCHTGDERAHSAEFDGE
jgi:hypothetical protein